MVSFIVIGKNESFRLQLCISSIFRFASVNLIGEYEVIYVDSRSTDGSVTELLKRGIEITVLQVEGECNAAISRNIGASVSKGDLLFFVDGDMELNSEFDFSQITKIKRPILASGQILNINYDSDYSTLLGTSDYYKDLAEPRKEIFFGGLFVISRELWMGAGGMRNTFVFGEDIDLSMRLSSSGHRLLRFNDYLAKHHTTEKKLNFRAILWNACYSRGYLYRKNLFNRFLANRLLKSDPTVLVLLLMLVLSVSFGFAFFFLYLLLVCLAVFLKPTKENFFVRFLHQLIRDFFVIFWFLFFHPVQSEEQFSTLRVGSVFKFQV